MSKNIRRCIEAANAAEVISNETYEMADVELEDLKTKSEKWDMIQWAIDKNIEFVRVKHAYVPDYELILAYDLERLEQLYKERETE